MKGMKNTVTHAVGNYLVDKENTRAIRFFHSGIFFASIKKQNFIDI